MLKVIGATLYVFMHGQAVITFNYPSMNVCQTVGAQTLQVLKGQDKGVTFICLPAVSEEAAPSPPPAPKDK